MPLQVHQFACLQDNYGFLARDEATGEVACIDTPDADAILAELDRLGWRLSLIMNTHWHPDHAGGNAVIQERTGCRIVGPQEVTRIAPLDRPVQDGDVVELGQTRFEVMDTGGHTLGHITYFDAPDRIAFVGDTLFALGCGRVFEGTHVQMWTSLSRLAALPEETRVYCAHEYTASNARFALSVDQSPALKARAEAVFAARERGEPTVPTTIGQEKAANPFLRAPLLKAGMGLQGVSDAEAFAAVRQAKDVFRGMIPASRIVEALDLKPHPEGGWYKETFRDPDPAGRGASTAIFYLLERGQVSAWHRVKDAAEVWHFYAGEPLKLSLAAPGEPAHDQVLGPDLLAGQTPQIVVPRGWWQAAAPLGAWTLVGCTVAPGFEFAAFEMAPPGWRPP